MMRANAGMAVSYAKPAAGARGNTEQQLRLHFRASYRQDAYPGPGFIHRDQRPGLQGVPVGLDGPDEQRPDAFRGHVLGADLDDARAAVPAVGQQHAEIEAVGEDGAAVLARPPQDFPARSIARAEG